jgi:hypothetical protein
MDRSSPAVATAFHGCRSGTAFDRAWPSACSSPGARACQEPLATPASVRQRACPLVDRLLGRHLVLGDGVGDADPAGEHAEHRGELDHRWSTATEGVPPKCSTATAAATSGSKGWQENTSTKQRAKISSAWMVIEAGLDELQRRPALELVIAEAVDHQRAVRAHDDGGDYGRHEPADAVGIGEPRAVAAVEIDRREYAPRAYVRPEGSGRAIVVVCMAYARAPLWRSRSTSTRRRSLPVRDFGSSSISSIASSRL